MRKVLIADDEPMIRDGLAEMLIGFESGLRIVGKAKNGVEALSMAEILLFWQLFVCLSCPDLIL